MLIFPELWNRNYFLRIQSRFRFGPLKSYGSGKGKSFKKVLEKNLPFHIVSFFTRKNFTSFIKLIENLNEKMLNEGSILYLVPVLEP
jgi:hypothetical protein